MVFFVWQYGLGSLTQLAKPVSPCLEQARQPNHDVFSYPNQELAKEPPESSKSQGPAQKWAKPELAEFELKKEIHEHTENTRQAKKTGTTSTFF